MIDLTYPLFLTLLGAGILTAALVPPIVAHYRLPRVVTLPIACVLGGIATGFFLDLPTIDVLDGGSIITHVTELVVLLSLTGCGLKIDRPLGLTSWGTTWRLLGITMILCIGAMTLLGWGLMGLPLAAALLLGAALAPTDPVLAASVQVGPPGEGDGDEARFALTSEAGLNDGLAFPFVHLALAAAAAMAVEGQVTGDNGRFTAEVLRDWVLHDVLWRLAAGLAVGVVIGRVTGWLAFRVAPAGSVADAFLALGLMLVSYGLAESVEGYGFLSVFVAALAFRRVEARHEIHSDLHHFVEQTEIMGLIVVMFVLGMAVGQGLLAPLGWAGGVVAALFLLVVRPVAGWVALTGAGLSPASRAAVSLLGIRGVGSIYYMAYGLGHAPFSIETGRLLWAVMTLIILVSIVFHGFAAPHMMSRLKDPTERVN
ncbi:cation:proton antiporter [Paracoccus sanguinis]|uniref:cation:proton antiporter n=1 Tax=Paracoccus sanguinis TaxID=1545044 RepID=UPI00051FADDD|nr:cation:proton antiporter [Paracoccus sanguinis]KGJ13374.1 hypothetical protein IX54_12205 [Paracoccus sanguinis]